MNGLYRAMLLACCCSGCVSRPVRTTETHRPDTQRMVYDAFVAQRTAELQRMGGPMSDRGVAHAKAEEEARGRYGDVPPDVSTTWSWGAGAGKEAAQKQVNESLEKMDRESQRR